MAANTRDATALTPFLSQKPAWGTTGNGWGQYSVLKFHVDMAAVKSGVGYTIDGSNADVVQMWDIPPGTYIHFVALKVTTAEGEAATVAVGDGSNTAGFLTATSINTTSEAMTIITDAYGATGGKSYAATDTLDLLFGTAADVNAAVFDVYVACTFINDLSA